MANERLVSNVYYRGTKVGTSEFLILDTSYYPKYNISIIDTATGGTVAANQLKQLGTYNFRLVSTTGKVQDIGQVYVRLTSPDGKITTDTNYVNTIIGVKEPVIAVDGSGNCTYELKVNFFPSLSTFTGKVEFFHNPERTLLIQAFDLSVQALTTASVWVRSRRFSEGTTTLPNVKMGEEFIIGINTTGPVGISNNTNVLSEYYGTVGGQVMSTTNPWLTSAYPGNKLTARNLDGITCRQYVPTNANPSNKVTQSIIVKAGDYTVTNYVENFDYPTPIVFTGYAAAFGTFLQFRALNMIPNNGDVSGMVRYTYMITSGRADGTQSSEDNTSSLFARWYQPNNSSRDVDVFTAGTNDGPRRATRGLISWNNTKFVMEPTIRQFTTLVGAGVFTGGMSKLTLASIKNSNVSFLNNFGNFRDSDIVICGMQSFKNDYVAFKRSADGTTIDLWNTNTNSALSLVAGQQFGVWVLKQIEVHPSFASDAPYPRIIYAKVAPIAINNNTPSSIVTMTHSSYNGINLDGRRYQIIYSYEIPVDNTGTGNANASRDYATGNGVRVGYDYGNRAYNLRRILNAVVVDFGPSFA